MPGVYYHIHGARLVSTDLGGMGAEIAPADSVADQIRALTNVTQEQSGSFIDRFGELVAW